MWLEFYQHLPETLNPIAFRIGFLSVRWYSLMYPIGFVVVFLLLSWRMAKDETWMIEKVACGINAKRILRNVLFDLMLMAFIGGLIGGRIAYVIFYGLRYFLAHPIEIISPFDGNTGSFEGFYGMSYHGAVIGGILASYIFLRKKKLDFLNWADFVVPALPLGYFFGRVGNFLNGELFGVVTDSKFGMFFLSSPDLLRYPSQLFEAVTEGALLFIVLWGIRNRKNFEKGSMLSFYIFGYCCFRFLCEFFRNPDVQLGYLFWGLTMGQILSVISILILSGWLFLKNKKSAII